MFEGLRDKIKPFSDLFGKMFSFLHPNTITIIGFLASFIPVYFFIKGGVFLAGISMIVYALDFLDGAVARYTKRVSIFGEVLDAVLDRVTDGFLIWAIAIGGFVSWNLAFIVLLGFYLVSYIRARAGEATAKEVKLNIGIGQRGDRLLLIFLASIFYFDKITIPIIKCNLNSMELVFCLLVFTTWETVIVRMIQAFKLIK
jgi:phosphatidylglycerophosphate synthase